MKAVYMRYGASYIEECDELGEATAMLNGGEDMGELSAVGVYDEATDTAWIPDVGSERRRDTRYSHLREILGLPQDRDFAHRKEFEYLPD